MQGRGWCIGGAKFFTESDSGDANNGGTYKRRVQ